MTLLHGTMSQPLGARWQRHTRRVLLIATLAVAIPPATARADLASSMTADLQQTASNVPGVSVSIGTPVGVETDLGSGVTTVAHVTLNAQPGNALAGIINDPLAPLYTTTAAQIPVWELAVMEAAKHALAAGNQLDAISVTENVSVGDPTPGDPDLVVRLQGREITSQPAATLSTSDVKTRLQSALPVWATNAAISVVPDAAGERAVTATLALPRDAFRALDIPALAGALNAQQDALASAGADIGRIVVEIDDAVTQEPLYVAGVDGFMGVGNSWVSPLVAGYMGQAPAAEDLPQTVTVIANNPTGPPRPGP